MPGFQLSFFENTQMLLVASGADVVSDKVASGFKECERMNGLKPWIRKMQRMERNAEKA